MVVHEVADRLGRDHHHADGDEHRGDHHRDLVDHPDRGDNRVEAEDRVEQDDLHDDRPERCGAGSCRRVALLALELLVDFEGRLADEEQSAEQEDEITPADFLPDDLEERVRQADHPAQAEEQEDAHSGGEAQAHDPRSILLLGRQLRGEDADEDDVVDAQDDLEGRQGEQCDPDLGIGQEFEHGDYRSLLATAKASLAARNVASRSAAE